MKTNKDAYKRLFLISFSIVFIILVLFHVDYTNGPWYWRWPWRCLSPLKTALYMLLPGLLFAYAIWNIEKKKVKAALILLVISCFIFQFAGILLEPASYHQIENIVTSENITSYFTDASKITDLREFLSTFHLQELSLHSMTHPPGPILYYYLFIRLFGTNAALIGGIFVGIIASLGVLAAYTLSKLWTQNKKKRLIISALYSLIPGLILFFPEMDQIYPLLTMLLIYSWEMSLRRDVRFVLLFSLILFISTLFSYSLLTLGAFIILSSAYYVIQKQEVKKVLLNCLNSAYYVIQKQEVKKVLLNCLYAMLAFCLLHIILNITTGYNPILSFRSAVANQNMIGANVGRPYIHTIYFDIYDFFLGSGIITFPLLLLYLKDSIKSKKNYGIVLSYIGLITVLLVNFTGLIRTETARVWLFLQPFVIIPAGLALSKLEKQDICLLFLILWFTLVIIKSNMYFIF